MPQPKRILRADIWKARMEHEFPGSKIHFSVTSPVDFMRSVELKQCSYTHYREHMLRYGLIELPDCAAAPLLRDFMQVHEICPAGFGWLCRTLPCTPEELWRKLPHDYMMWVYTRYGVLDTGDALRLVRDVLLACGPEMKEARKAAFFIEICIKTKGGLGRDFDDREDYTPLVRTALYAICTMGDVNLQGLASGPLLDAVEECHWLLCGKEDMGGVMYPAERHALMAKLHTDVIPVAIKRAIRSQESAELSAP